MMLLLSILIGLAIETPKVINVCSSGCPYSSIQEAVASAPEGSSIQIATGTYKLDSTVKIDKKLTLLGQGSPILIGSDQEDVIRISASGVTVEGLDLRNSGTSYLHEIAGIRVEDVTECNIHRNIISSNAYGIYLANSEHCSVSDNIIQGSYHSESESGNGIHSWSGRFHNLSNNSIHGHRDGIYLEFTNDSSVTNNHVSQNIRYGLHFMSSHRNLYQNNKFTQNGAGVAVMYSRKIRMLDNEFADNQGMAAYGLLLKDISEGEIRGNSFHDNTYGVYMEGTNRSKFRQNSFSDNGYGLRILGDCDDNEFYHNNFQGNTFDTSTNSERNPNVFNENYWSNYRGYDLDKDGVGDIPYRPVSLSSLIVEKMDSTYLLIKSPLLLLLDQIEQAFPMLIPESLKDSRPLMQPWRG